MSYISTYSKEELKRNFDGLVKAVSTDYPYPLDLSANVTAEIFEQVHADLERQHVKIQDKYFSRDGKGVINLAFLDHYLVLCFRFAQALSREGMREHADAVYYSSRMRTATDLYHANQIGDFFLPNHTMGTVFDSHAKFGIGLRIHNNTHIGPYNVQGNNQSAQKHPVIGDGVIIFGNVSIYGNTTIGNNVTVSAGSKIINEEIPDDCIVMGASPNLMVLPNKFNNLSLIGM